MQICWNTTAPRGRPRVSPGQASVPVPSISTSPGISPSVKSFLKSEIKKKYLSPHPNSGAGLPLCWVSEWIFELRPEFLSYRVGIHNFLFFFIYNIFCFGIFGWVHFLGGLLWKKLSKMTPKSGGSFGNVLETWPSISPKNGIFLFWMGPFWYFCFLDGPIF